MSDYSNIAEQLQARLDQLLERAEVIEDDLRHPLDDDLEEQAIDLADDEALEGVDDVLRAEIAQLRLALLRIANGTYGTCSNCGAQIDPRRLQARPIATRCIKCAA
ncbi:TraR/DksA family transcriptional regulator [Erythrobacter sp. HL-111]|uniref:TraR/DksA family transcriptional regulator n=1 Tax=Erythrobacter sp. HL-111 TaxID=1798193 RepID=UPI0006D98DFD|nr:TraR/DksA family transcriptional regulator [Erythrobacter sp. HL-111]KPP96209.1 MAG: transcriptional regulator, TraR/DksA family [Erythrobacteraceae bacterium HL-111]SDR77941.1 transcriptional regulator, TraR/DksA family [Erythrobacter sp. HL-111]